MQTKNLRLQSNDRLLLFYFNLSAFVNNDLCMEQVLAQVLGCCICQKPKIFALLNRCEARRWQAVAVLFELSLV